MTMTSVTTIDGSYGEGGGQILRNACTYAAILGSNVRITNIRAGRKVPGLRPQHLVGLRMLAAISGGFLAEGNNVGSTEILFVGEKRDDNEDSTDLDSPYRIRDVTDDIERMKDTAFGEEKLTLIGDTQTAGSVCLLMQTILPFALFCGNSIDEDGAVTNTDGLLRIILKGGTDVDFSPPIDYYRFVFLPILQNYCYLVAGKDEAEIKSEELRQALIISLIRRGFFPRGGGEIRLAIHRLSLKTLPLPPIRLTERGSIISIIIRAFAVGKCPLSMAQTVSTICKQLIQCNPRYKTIPVTIEISNESEQPLHTDKMTADPGRGKKRPRSVNSGCGVLIMARTDKGCLLGGSSIGSPKIPLNETARIATQEIVDAMDGGGCVDDYLQDQLILYMALADGVSEIVTNSLTLHTKTAIWLASKMLPKVSFEITNLGTVEQDAKTTGRLNTTELMPPSINDKDRRIGERIPGRHRIRCHGIGFSSS